MKPIYRMLSSGAVALLGLGATFLASQWSQHPPSAEAPMAAMELGVRCIGSLAVGVAVFCLMAGKKMRPVPVTLLGGACGLSVTSMFGIWLALAYAFAIAVGVPIRLARIADEALNEKGGMN